MAKRLGVFGGTFDPPHIGHLIVATVAREALGLDQMVLIPAADPPHKEQVSTPPEIRLAMLNAAVDAEPDLVVDSVEIDRGGTSYTVDTLTDLAARFPDAEITFLMGSDQFDAFATWKQPDRIQELARVAVMQRGGETIRSNATYEYIPVPVPRIDISSTAIRERIAQGRSVRFWIPEPVRKIVEEMRLYRDAPAQRDE